MFSDLYKFKQSAEAWKDWLLIHRLQLAVKKKVKPFQFSKYPYPQGMFHAPVNLEWLYIHVKYNTTWSCVQPVVVHISVQQ